MEAASRITVLIADDHPIFRAAVRALLHAEPDITVVAEAADGEEALALTQELQPSVVVMDVTMPVLDGIAATEQIATRFPETQVLILTMHEEDSFLFDALRAGASGYVRKQATESDLLEAIRAINRGDAFLYPSGIRLLLSAYLKATDPAQALQLLNGLTPREEQVLTLTAEGYSNQEIAGRLYLSVKTVDTDRQRIMDKLHLRHRTELVRYAIGRGLLQARRDSA